MNCSKRLLILSAALCAFAGSAGATILNVPTDHRSILSAVVSAHSGDTVLVQPGVYNEHVEWPGVDFTLASLFLITGDSAYIDSTVISGEGTGRSCISFRSASGHGPRVVGFTLRDAITDYGGGIYIIHNAPTIENVKIVNCEATERGGGIDCSVEATPILRNLTLIGNRAPLGGGLGVNSTEIVIEGVRILGNVASRSGGGVYVTRSTLTMSNFEVAGNETDTTRDGYGGGIDVYTGTLALRDGIIKDNIARMGGGIASTEGQTGIDLARVVIDSNYAAAEGGILYFEGAPTLRLNHLTVARNRSPEPLAQIGTDRYTILNSIFWEDADSVMNLGGYQEGVSRIDYCLYRSIANGFRGEGADEMRRNGHFLETDPLFVDEEGGDYHLHENSPAIDAGDPDSEKDPDSTRADIGAFSNTLPNLVEGRVTDRATGLSVASANILLGDTRNTVTNEDGYYKFRGVRQSPFRLFVTVPGFSDLTSDEFEVARDDTLNIDLALLRALIIINGDEINRALRAQCSTFVALPIMNDGAGDLHWKARVEFNDLSWKPAMSPRNEIDLRQLLAGTEVTGATLRGDRWYISGQDREAGLYIWVFDRVWNLIGRYPQGERRWPGILDIEFDGEFLWGADRESICRYDLTFEDLVTFAAPEGLASVRAIACDERRGLIWAGVGTRFRAIDREGNVVSQVRTVPGLSIRNLAFWDDAPDGFNLVTVRDSTAQVYGVNPATGETSLLGSIAADTLRSISSASVCPELDKYGAIPLVLVNAEPGNELIKVRQLAPAPPWMTLVAEEGALEPGEQGVVVIRLQAPGEGDEEFTGRIWFGQNGLADVAFVDVTLTVEPNSVDDTVLLPIENSLSAFPNPFNDRTMIRYALREPGKVRIEVCDIIGREVARFDEGVSSAGIHTISWDASSFASGVYLVRMEMGSQVMTKKILLVR